MIQVARLNGNPLVVNSDLIRYVESAPDTTITLINGEKIVVLESCDEVVSRTIAWRARLLSEAAKLSPAAAWWMAPVSAIQAVAEAGAEQDEEMESGSAAAQRRRSDS
ncbi:flagellar FlbD family protein [Paracidobacterium acidisoli]|uniref:Flagellar protein FlbD n=1 Tax=Paracidobacterium acidisoli TaxID=2303751 RepID=A0A372IUB7_9BACT|nr:flagellar FlbD family protein [Paracidobacterium acidisoli]MBT9329962.1 flagellar FlbD family protein [Paracidobacterium acidisoli]